MKLGQSYYLLQFGFIYPYITWPQNTMFVHIGITYLHLPLFTYSWSNVALITIIYSYLPWFDYTCHIHPIYILFLLGLHLCE